MWNIYYSTANEKNLELIFCHYYHACHIAIAKCQSKNSSFYQTINIAAKEHQKIEWKERKLKIWPRFSIYLLWRGLDPVRTLLFSSPRAPALRCCSWSKPPLSLPKSRALWAPQSSECSSTSRIREQAMHFLEAILLSPPSLPLNHHSHGKRS